MPELKDFASSVAIIVSSCDAFFDACGRLLLPQALERLSIPIFLIVNVCESARTSCSRSQLTGSKLGVQHAGRLAQIAQPYVLYLQEDYFLNGSIKRGQLPLICLRFRARRRFILLLRPLNARARFCPAKRSIRGCPPRFGRAHSPSGHVVEERRSASNAPARGIGVEYGSARQ
jgi:hypothetical protein